MEKRPFVTKAQVEEIVKTHPTPFHLYDEKGIRENARRLKQAFAWNKGFKEYFAVKATPNPFIMQVLKEEGIGVDCSSYTELMLAETVGFSGDDIMFSSNVTPAEDFALADRLGAIINFDDLTHVDFYKNIAPFHKTMSCRYNPGGDFTLHNSIMDTPQDAKYGMSREQMKEAFLKMKSYGVEHFGIHSFLASNTTENGYYPKLARILFELAVWLHEETGVHISFINLSGGVGIPYRPDQKANDIMIICRFGGYFHLHRAGPLYAGSLRLPGGQSYPRKAHLERIHRFGCLCGGPDAPGYVRRLSSHHRAGQRERPLRPCVRCDRWPVREQ